jgi:hypothetical protein
MVGETTASTATEPTRTPARPLGPRPATVRAVAAALGCIGVLTGALLFTPPVLQLYESGGREWPRMFIWLSFVWTFVAALGFCRPFFSGKAWAWSSLAGILFVRLAGGITTLAGVAVLEISRPASFNLSHLVGPAIYLGYTLVVIALLAAVVRSRGWFGIGDREIWRTMRSKGALAMTITLLLDIGVFASLAQTLNRYVR